MGTWRFVFTALPHGLKFFVKLLSEWTVTILVCTWQIFISRQFEAPHVFDSAYNNSCIKIYLSD